MAEKHSLAKAKTKSLALFAAILPIFRMAHTKSECLNAKKTCQLNGFLSSSSEAFEKGESIGEVIGKFGIDILLTKGTGKAYSSLKKANQYMTLEALASPATKGTVVKEASEYLARREQVLKSANLKIQWDKQGKHLEGHRNYKPKDTKSILEHPDPQRLVKEHAGKGRKVSPDSKLPGHPGYKEVVDFEEFIGYHVDESTKVKLPTTRGTIHYAQDGVHVVPARPEG